MIHKNDKESALILAVCVTVLALLTGCSSASSSDVTSSAKQPQGGASGSVTPAPPTKAKAASAKSVVRGECTNSSILAALPAGTTIVKYECAIASPTMWAAARVKPGPTVYFLQAKSGSWKVSKADQVCGISKAVLPREIGAFCPKA